jgi:L-ascorbate metabolism protein UlaG (beta-lactamase superfamily)
MPTETAMPLSRAAACLAIALSAVSLLWPVGGARAQADPVPSKCMAIAQALPSVTHASFTPAQATRTSGEVTITYAGHSTYVLETPGGVRIATDFSGAYGRDPLPRIITMNKAHSTHFTNSPDPRIEHVLPGWNPDGTDPARHALVVDDVYIRNVTTDIRRFGTMEENANSIFIFEVADLCIGHLGHLHHALTNEHYAAIGRLDIVMVPVDGGMTQSLANMSEITARLSSSIVLPMHRHATPMGEFLAMMGERFAVDFRDERSVTVSQRDLPRRPTILILRGV